MVRRIPDRVQKAMRSVDQRDIWLALLFSISAGIASFVLSGNIPSVLYQSYSGDFWFESDLPRIFTMMTSRWGNPRSTHHPIMAITMLLPTSFLIKLGVNELTSIRLVLASISALWTALLYSLLRSIDCRRVDAVVFTLLGVSTSATIFFFAVPEAFLLGSMTIIIGILWAALDEEGKGSPLGESFVSAATLGITLTNFMVGIFSSFYRRSFRRALQISASGLAIVILIWTAQKYVVPESQSFLDVSLFSIEKQHFFSPEAGGFVNIATGFFAHTMVMPEIQLVDRPSSGRWPLLLTQTSMPGSAGPWGLLALSLWALLLIAGLISLVRITQRPRLRLILGSVLLGQFALHLVFGNETFLYSSHWVPVLVVIAALSTLTRWRLTVLALAGLFCLSATANNLLQFHQAIQFINSYQPIVERVEAAEHRQLRTEDPWPRTAIAITTPWDRDDYDMAAYEPGGGFWPAMDTFNIAVWVADASGKTIVTSHEFGEHDVNCRVTTEPNSEPRIESKTTYYALDWQGLKRRSWRLNLMVFRHQDKQLFIVLRGVGWRFSHIRSIVRDNDGLLINSRWRVTMTPMTGDMRIGEEGQPGWMLPDVKTTRVESKTGWGIARIGPLTPGDYEFMIFDSLANESVDTFLGTISY
jgi:hypothetical protein